MKFILVVTVFFLCSVSCSSGSRPDANLKLLGKSGEREMQPETKTERFPELDHGNLRGIQDTSRNNRWFPHPLAWTKSTELGNNNIIEIFFAVAGRRILRWIETASAQTQDGEMVRKPRRKWFLYVIFFGCQAFVPNGFSRCKTWWIHPSILLKPKWPKFI